MEGLYRTTAWRHVNYFWYLKKTGIWKRHIIAAGINRRFIEAEWNTASSGLHIDLTGGSQRNMNATEGEHEINIPLPLR